MVNVFKSAQAREKVISSYDELLKLWDTDFEARNIATRYGTTHCLTAGNASNPPLMLFHGVGDNSALMWALNMKALSSRFYCIAVDTLGGPGKSVPNERFTKKFFNQTDWIDELADRFGLETMYAAGVSNGAHMAYHYTVARPERVIRTICLEGGMVKYPLKAMLGTMMMMFPEMLVPTDGNLRKIIRKLSAPSSAVFDVHPQLEDHLVLLMKSHNQRAMFPHQPHKYYKEQGAAARDKLYFLAGDHHSVVKKELVALLETDGFRYGIVHGAGHAINHEQPDRVHREIFQFLLGDPSHA